MTTTEEFTSESCEFTALLGMVNPLPFNFLNIHWSFTPYTLMTPEVSYLSGSLDCFHSQIFSNLWHLDAEIEVKVERKPGEMVEKKLDLLFNKESIFHDLGQIMAIDDSFFSGVDPLYVLPKKKFELKIRIKSLAGFRIPPKLTDFSVSKDNDSQVVLRIGDDKLFVDKCCLIGFSSVFRDLLPDGKKEIEIKDVKIEIKDVKIENFKAFLRLLYREEQEITSDNVEELLKLVHKYDVHFLLNECEDFVRSSGKITTIEKLYLAELYDFSLLQAEVLAKLTREDFKKLEEEIRYMGGYTAQALLAKLIEISEHETNNKRLTRAIAENDFKTLFDIFTKQGGFNDEQFTTLLNHCWDTNSQFFGKMLEAWLQITPPEFQWIPGSQQPLSNFIPEQLLQFLPHHNVPYLMREQTQNWTGIEEQQRKRDEPSTSSTLDDHLEIKRPRIQP